jgi:hypothetical protein
MDAFNRVRFEEIKNYDFDEVFEKPPLVNNFKEKRIESLEGDDEGEVRISSTGWREFHALIFREGGRYTQQAIDQLRYIRDRRLLNEETDYQKNYPLLNLRKDEQTINMEERKIRLAKALQQQLRKF